MSSAIDIIIPVGGEGYGGELLEECIAKTESFTDHDLTFIIVRDSPNCGAGWIEGLKESTAPYVWLSADDIEPYNVRWAEVCIESTDRGELPAPTVWTPQGRLESCGGNMQAPGNLNTTLVDDETRCDFGGAPFCSREQIDAIGMLPIQVCSDVWVHYRGRQLGYKSVVRRDFELIHHRPSHADNTEDMQTMRAALELTRA